MPLTNINHGSESDILSSIDTPNDSKISPIQIVKVNSDVLLKVFKDEAPNLGNQLKNDIMLFENPWYSNHVKNYSSHQLTNVAEKLPLLELYKSYTTLFDDKLTIQRVNMTSKIDFTSSMEVNHTNWNEHFPGTTTLDGNYRSLMVNRIAVCLDTHEDFAGIFDFIRANATVFILDLKRGSLEDFNKIFELLRLTNNFVSRSINIPLQFSAISNISERLPITGSFHKNYLNVIKLKYGNRIIITADRRYATNGTKNVIYVNCLSYITKLKSCDLIIIGKLHFRVIEQVNISALCQVIRNGIIIPKESVIFPTHCSIDVNDITLEEINDINYTKSVLINCIILPTYDCNNYYNSIQNYLNTINYSYCRIFATIYCKDNDDISMNDVDLIANTYDGLKLYIYRNDRYRKEILNISNITKYLIEQFYLRKKPILLGKFLTINTLSDQSILIESDCEKYIYFYPDKYILEINEKRSNYIETYSLIQYYHKLIIHEYAFEKLTEKLNEYYLSENDIFARTIVKGTYDYFVNCIILSSKSGRIAIKIAHYRPNCSIVVLCNNINVLRFLNIYHNILVAFYNTKYKINPQLLNLKKLWYGLIYAYALNAIKLEQNVMYIYEINSIQKIALFKFTAQLYDRLSQI